MFKEERAESQFRSKKRSSMRLQQPFTIFAQEGSLHPIHMHSSDEIGHPATSFWAFRIDPFPITQDRRNKKEDQHGW